MARPGGLYIFKEVKSDNFMELLAAGGCGTGKSDLGAISFLSCFLEAFEVNFLQVMCHGYQSDLCFHLL